MHDDDSGPGLGREVLRYVDELIRHTGNEAGDPQGVLSMVRHGLRPLVESHVLRPTPRDDADVVVPDEVAVRAAIRQHFTNLHCTIFGQSFMVAGNPEWAQPAEDWLYEQITAVRAIADPTDIAHTLAVALYRCSNYPHAANQQTLAAIQAYCTAAGVEPDDLATAEG